MKKLIYLSTVMLVLIVSSFTIQNTFETNDNETILKTCEYSFYVKCDGSNQFVEIIRAKDGSTAKKMCTERYSKCKVTTKNMTHPKNCK